MGGRGWGRKGFVTFGHDLRFFSNQKQHDPDLMPLTQFNISQLTKCFALLRNFWWERGLPARLSESGGLPGAHL